MTPAKTPAKLSGSQPSGAKIVTLKPAAAKTVGAKTAAAKTVAWQLSSDRALGLVGCGLAAASASFGIYMSIHGPGAPTPNTTGDFSVFAQLAPRPSAGPRTHGPSKDDQDLDLTATASIAAPAGPGGRTEAVVAPVAGPDSNAAGPIVPGIVLASAGDSTAEIAIDGRMREVRIGDSIPGAGQVLEIVPGRWPMLKTSRGVILAAGR